MGRDFSAGNVLAAGAEGNGFCWFLGVIRWDGRLAANSLLAILHRGSCILASGCIIGLSIIILLWKSYNISFGKISILSSLPVFAILDHTSAHVLAHLLRCCCSTRGICFYFLCSSFSSIINLFSSIQFLFFFRFLHSCPPFVLSSFFFCYLLLFNFSDQSKIWNHDDCKKRFFFSGEKYFYW